MGIRFFGHIVLVFVVCSCASYSEDLEEVLQQAGKNRGELEKVLKHYRKNPVDSLKLQAAEFLIVNMPGKYSEYYDASWNDVATASMYRSTISNEQTLLDACKLGRLIRKDDLTHITGNYLIHNIELAFLVWEEMPWGKDVSFNVFCEEILPYRHSTEPLENWRKKVLAIYADLYNLFRDTVITAVEACCRVNDKLPRFVFETGFPPMNYSQLMATSRGSDEHRAALSVFVMRGIGIPVSVDFTPRWPSIPVAGKTWNNVRDSLGVPIPFLGRESNPGIQLLACLFHKSKVYRYSFVNRKHVVTDTANIPPLLRSINHTVDVTSEYGNCADVHLPVFNGHISQTDYACLATPDTMEWQAVAFGHVTADSMHFLSVGKNILYLPVYYFDGVQTPAFFPFFLDETGTCRVLRPDTVHPESITLFSQPEFFWSSKMQGGRFEGANRSDFSDARLIYRIETNPGPYIHAVSIKKLTPAYRYVRYMSPAGGICNVSIIEFYDENNEELQGSILGESPAGWYTPYTQYDKAFDGDVDTYVCAWTDHSWTGLDLGESRRIGKIRYLPPTNGCGIYEGHVYELFFWDGDGWRSLGEKRAGSHYLQYEAPANALYILKNNTRDRVITLPFFMEDGKQRWF